MSSFLTRRLAITSTVTSRAFSVSARRQIAKITLVGNLAATPEVKATSTGRSYVEYAVASNEGRGENKKVSWFRVAAFIDEGPQRDFMTSLAKGSTVFVEGDATLRQYVDSEGKNQTRLNIYQKAFEVLRRGVQQTE
ncbi:nucleic acid-binding protein [Xylariaceae sp. FL0594]|nr:nucleic acid-binding protein [Xylariaceae sp. FL0594]